MEDADTIFKQYQGTDSNTAWLGSLILGRNEEATKAVAKLIESDLPYQRSMPLTYRVFDPSPFPSVLELLERENIQRPPPLQMPFRCQTS